MKKVVFQIEGMSCQNCVGKINAVLGSAPGIKKYHVSLENKSADIIYKDNIITHQTIQNQLNETSFSIQLANEPQAVTEKSILDKIKDTFSQ